MNFLYFRDKTVTTENTYMQKNVLNLNKSVRTNFKQN